MPKLLLDNDVTPKKPKPKFRQVQIDPHGGKTLKIAKEIKKKYRMDI